MIICVYLYVILYVNSDEVMMILVNTHHTGVSIHWTGLLDWITGLDYWTGLLDSILFFVFLRFIAKLN